MSEHIVSLNGYRLGQRVEAREVYSPVWRPAVIDSFTTHRDGPGCYLHWLDVDPGDLSKSQGGWQPLSAIREVAP